MSERLILEIEVPEFNVDGAQDVADSYYDGDVLPIVVDEWMRGDVIVVANDIPGEKSQNHEFNIHALAGRIIGARIEADRPNPAMVAAFGTKEGGEKA